MTNGSDVEIIYPTYGVSREELDEVIANLREAGSEAHDDDAACLWITVAMNGKRQRRCLT
jgi:uncharacterized tellurite resistance protein B-like protein